jgi:hypothetical protein
MVHVLTRQQKTLFIEFEHILAHRALGALLDVRGVYGHNGEPRDGFLRGGGRTRGAPPLLEDLVHDRFERRLAPPAKHLGRRAAEKRLQQLVQPAVAAAPTHPTCVDDFNGHVPPSNASTAAKPTQ